jgi:hypothetical protein
MHEKFTENIWPYKKQSRVTLCGWYNNRFKCNSKTSINNHIQLPNHKIKLFQNRNHEECSIRNIWVCVMLILSLPTQMFNRIDARAVQFYKICFFQVLLYCPIIASTQCRRTVQEIKYENALCLTMPSTTTPLTAKNA